MSCEKLSGLAQPSVFPAFMRKTMKKIGPYGGHQALVFERGQTDGMAALIDST